MSLHDAYARVTPFEFAFRDQSRADQLVADVEEEARGRGADVAAPHAFVTMGAVAGFVAEIEGPDAPVGATHQYGALAFQGYHFTKASFPLYLLTTHAVRYLVEGSPGGVVSAPTPAGYLQLPQHLFWTDSGQGPESVDGVFWTTTENGALHALLASGVRSDGSGLGVVPLPEAPMADASDWLGLDARGDGRDFASDLPGADIDGLYSVASSGEVLKLLSRFWAYMEAVPDAAERSAPTTEVAAGDDGSQNADPEPSALPYTRVTLSG
jgi:hypothetical protein